MTRIYSERGVSPSQATYTRTPGDLESRIAAALIPLGLAKTITWDEAAYVMEAIHYYDRREAANWRRQQEIIRQGGL